MLTLRPIRRFGHSAAAANSRRNVPAAVSCLVNDNQQPLDEPALIKLKKERDPEKLFRLFKANAHNRLVIENRFAFEDTVSRLAGARRFDYVEELLEQQKSLPQGRREGFIVRIIMLYGKAGMTKHAVDTFCDMPLYGCNRTVKSFNATLKVLAETRDLGATHDFLTENPKKFNISLDIYSVNIVIKFLSEMGFSEKAYLFMVQMEKEGIQPDVITYTTLISALYRIRSWELGNGLWNLMVLKGCSPNLATFNVRIQFLVNMRRPYEANKLLGLMQKIAISPDEITYNLVIKGFCQTGNFDMARRVHSALCDKGFKPNLQIYQTWIHYLCRSGEFGLAYRMSKDCMTKNLFPNVDTIHTLIKALNKNGEVGKAKFTIQLAEKRVPPFSKMRLDSFRSALLRS